MATGVIEQPLGVYGPVIPDPTNYPSIRYYTYGKIAFIKIQANVTGGSGTIQIPGFPKSKEYMVMPVWNDIGYVEINNQGVLGLRANTEGTHTIYNTLVYPIAD